MPRRRKTDTTICRDFCVYYKPGKNEDLLCGGYRVVQRLRTRQMLPAIDRTGTPAADPAAMALLKERVCTGCSFREADCDFIATSGRSAPCGGVTYLAHLLAAGEVTPSALTSAGTRRQRRRS